MTDGILLREIQSDFLLQKYSVIILDEAHERNLNTDILIGLLSKILYLRNEKENTLKIVIMSATLRIEDFRENPKLFPNPPPVIHVPSRQHPVTCHFSKTTVTDNWQEVLFHKVNLKNVMERSFVEICKLHLKLPLGHVLVFLTGKREIEDMCKRLNERFANPITDQNEDKEKETVEDVTNAMEMLDEEDEEDQSEGKFFWK